jgi:hypothetical protein
MLAETGHSNVMTFPPRHGRARHGHPRLFKIQNVDARDKRGHDGSNIMTIGITSRGKPLPRISDATEAGDDGFRASVHERLINK